MLYEVEVEFKGSHIMLVEAPGREEASELACERLLDIDRGALAMDELELGNVWINIPDKNDYIDPDKDRE